MGEARPVDFVANDRKPNKTPSIARQGRQAGEVQP